MSWGRHSVVTVVSIVIMDVTVRVETDISKSGLRKGPLDRLKTGYSIFRV